jgi:hypothetical protein
MSAFAISGSFRAQGLSTFDDAGCLDAGAHPHAQDEHRHFPVVPHLRLPHTPHGEQKAFHMAAAQIAAITICLHC